MSKMEEKYVNQATVSPHWSSDGNTFWYIRNFFPNKFNFIFVDAVNKQSRPAFDHEKLAEAIRKQTGQEVDASCLPFNWIDLAVDGSSARFLYNEIKWCFYQDNTLQEWHSALGQPKSQFLSKERASGYSDRQVTVTFVNRTNADLSKYWIDWKSNLKFYGKLGHGQSHSQKTYASHVWKLVDDASGTVKAIYAVPEESESSVVIDDKTMDQAASQDELNEEKVENVAQDEAELPQLFVQDFNLWLRDIDKRETVLASNGTEDHKYDRSKIFMSPNKKFVVAWQYTPEDDHKIHLREAAPKDQLEPRLNSIRYLKPGDRVRVDRPRLFSLESRSELPVDDKSFRNPYKLQDLGWSHDSSEYRFIFNERGHQHLRIIGINTEGVVRSLVEERSDTFIDYSSKLYVRVVEESDEIIWASERDCFNHLYIFSLIRGELVLQVTKGEWNVNSVVFVDEKKRQIWFQGYGMVSGQDPYYAHLARVNFDGTDLKVLTDGDGTHNWSLSPNNRYFVDTWSRVDSPPRSVLRDLMTGEQLVHLEGNDSDLEEWLDNGWVSPERFTALGRDGETPIYGIIIRPSGYDPSRKYPILESIYAGPHDFHTPKEFSALSQQRKWSDQGYVVVQLDGMGTNWRSKKFHNICWKNLKDGGFPDRIAWIKAAAETRPWMDISRVGLVGASAGGQNAVAALLFHGGFYKAAVADSGCHDNRMDKLWWNEQWMGYPVDKSYEESSNTVHASKLTGALMLIVGELDDNVDPASTLQLVKALNDADKDYEFLLIPSGEHCCGRTKSALRRQEAFFRRHLRGTEEMS